MKQKRYWLAASLVSVAIFLVLAEVTLRMSGSKPRTLKELPEQHRVGRPDPDTGWANKEGAYILPPFNPGGEEIHMTFLPDGNRVTGQAEGTTRDQIVLVGGSFTQGLGISDAETFPWKLQAKFPASKILNYGTSGYGTYQSLLMLERVLPQLAAPSRVLYGFYEHHEYRNVAPAHWIISLTAQRRSDDASIPFASLDHEGNLIRRQPGKHLTLPLSEYLATVAFIETLYMRVKDGVGKNDRIHQARRVTEALLLEMNAVSDAHGAEFGVILLNAEASTARHYQQFLRRNGIQTIDCNRPLTPDLTIPGDWHPNGALNTIWADCIAAAVTVSPSQ